MAKLEDFIVQTPYQPSDKEKAAISELKAKGLVPGLEFRQKRYRVV